MTTRTKTSQPKRKLRYAEDGKTPIKTVRARLLWVAKQITAHPEKYDQGHWGGLYYGTVGCIAGWLDAKVNGMKKHSSAVSETDIIIRARTALGLYSIPLLFEADATGRHSKPGTKRHAQQGVRAINKYLKELGPDYEEVTNG